MKVDYVTVNRTKDGHIQLRARTDPVLYEKTGRPQTSLLEFDSVKDAVGFACTIINNLVKDD